MPASYPDLNGKAVYVTGGATGIGAAIVTAFAQQGARVHFIDIDIEAAKKLVEETRKHASASITCELCDATDNQALQQSVRQFAEEKGIDILVNNVANDTRHDLAETTADQWRAIMAVNLDPAFFASQAAAALMNNGAIINLSSINALFGPQGLIGYNTAKAGLLGLTRSLASELGEKQIRVNSILPGWVATERQLALWLKPEAEAEWQKLTKLKGRIHVEDIANCALFLGSDASRMITGQQFIVDAGQV